MSDCKAQRCLTVFDLLQPILLGRSFTVDAKEPKHNEACDLLGPGKGAEVGPTSRNRFTE